ncbi:MAG: hypothetical protein JW736_02395 [Deltaproteobacteria bacterium]|nr:hypothetical protein [Deltaproteobacteria bacterium]
MTNTEVCSVCRKAPGVITCSGCRKVLLCLSCAHFELVGSGCGTVYPLYYCPACAYDEQINPNACFKDPKPSDSG